MRSTNFAKANKTFTLAYKDVKSEKNTATELTELRVEIKEHIFMAHSEYV